MGKSRLTLLPPLPSQPASLFAYRKESKRSKFCPTLLMSNVFDLSWVFFWERERERESRTFSCSCSGSTHTFQSEYIFFWLIFISRTINQHERERKRAKIRKTGGGGHPVIVCNNTAAAAAFFMVFYQKRKRKRKGLVHWVCVCQSMRFYTLFRLLLLLMLSWKGKNCPLHFLLLLACINLATTLFFALIHSFSKYFLDLVFALSSSPSPLNTARQIYYIHVYTLFITWERI